MWSTAREVAAGDTVIIWLTRDQIQPLVISPGKIFNTRFGNFKHSDFVGTPYGSKVVPKSGRGFIYLLRPTPELWTLALPHRTQILYLADIAFITSYLGIKKDSKVIEAGTGSASFSHSVARTIGPTGHLWSYEFHEARFNKAKEEFSRHGMDDRVTLQHRNVCKDGFTVVDLADAVFLDLPAPWDAVDYAKKSLRKDRNTRICCFSPCIEQVLRTVNKLNEAGFTEITTYETLLRPIEVFHTQAPQPVSIVAEKLKASERKREEKRLKQIQANKEKQAEQAKEKKRKRGKGEDETINATLVHDDGADQAKQAEEGTSKKRPRIQEDQEGLADEEEMDFASSTTTTISLSKAELSNDPISIPLALPAPTSQIPSSSEAIVSSSVSPAIPMSSSISPTPPKPQPPINTKINVSKALPEVRGHTSYLTFARLVPISSSSLPSSNASASVSTQSLELQAAGIGNDPLLAREQGDQTPT